MIIFVNCASHEVDAIIHEFLYIHVYCNIAHIMLHTLE